MHRSQTGCPPPWLQIPSLAKQRTEYIENKASQGLIGTQCLPNYVILTSLLGISTSRRVAVGGQPIALKSVGRSALDDLRCYEPQYFCALL